MLIKSIKSVKFTNIFYKKLKKTKLKIKKKMLIY